jgi:hypothetical protein
LIIKIYEFYILKLMVIVSYGRIFIKWLDVI